MSAWKKIPENGKIPCKGMAIVRKPNQKNGGWHIELAYKSIGNGWRTDLGSRGVSEYKEYAPIPE